LSLIRVYEAQGKLTESENIYKRMYDDINNASKILDRKAEKFINDSKFVEAQDLLKEVYKKKESALPILGALAELYIKHNKHAEALNCYKTCLEIREKLNDPEHFSVAESLNRIALMNKQLKQIEESEATLQRALKICEKALNTNENAIKFYRTRPKEEADIRIYKFKEE
jgi:tetratricopeptide (TPR) repeat protein